MMMEEASSKKRGNCNHVFLKIESEIGDHGAWHMPTSRLPLLYSPAEYDNTATLTMFDQRSPIPSDD